MVFYCYKCARLNWQKTKIQSTFDPAALPPSVLVTGNSVDIVESFVYLSSEVHSTGSSESEIRRRIGLAKTCFNQLNRGIWDSTRHGDLPRTENDGGNS